MATPAASFRKRRREVLAKGALLPDFRVYCARSVCIQNSNALGATRNARDPLMRCSLELRAEPGCSWEKLWRIDREFGATSRGCGSHCRSWRVRGKADRAADQVG